MPVFSFEKIRGADISLGPEMKSTGECLGIAKDFNEALYKAFVGAGVNLPKHKQMIMTVNDHEQKDALSVAKRLQLLDIQFMRQEVQHVISMKTALRQLRSIRLNRNHQHFLTLFLTTRLTLLSIYLRTVLKRATMVSLSEDMQSRPV